jgi:2-hydroxychromene-2-carboxylate isomerase
VSLSIDYYFSPHSPWTYLGHARFVAMAQAANATVRVLPVDYGRVFPQSGGLPLTKRAPQRQAYRLVELARFRDDLNLPLTLQPKFFPVAADDASRLIIAIERSQGTSAALKLSGALLAAVWVHEQNIADTDTLAQLLTQCGLSADALALLKTADVQAQYDANTLAAMEAGVFGAPTYVLQGEMFWGQDRLELLHKKLFKSTV